MGERISPPYELVKHKRDTKDKDTNHFGLVRVERTPKLENLNVLREVAFRFGLRVHILDTEERLQQNGRIKIEIVPEFGTILPNWKLFWESYEETKELRKKIKVSKRRVQDSDPHRS